MRERDCLEPSPARSTGYWVGSGCDISEDRTTTADPRSANCGVANGSPHEAGDPPGYSMFQERAPWALVTGEEHFTFLAYHSERRRQGPNKGFLPWTECCPVVCIAVGVLPCSLTVRQGMRDSPNPFALRT